jgi:hypothetical protein
VVEGLGGVVVDVVDVDGVGRLSGPAGFSDAGVAGTGFGTATRPAASRRCGITQLSMSW